MDLKQKLEELKNSEDFKTWNKENPENFLAHFFLTEQNGKINELQVGFYNKKKQKMKPFSIFESITALEEEKIFREPNKRIHELDIKKVKINLEDAIETIKKICLESYSQHPIMKSIIILQNIKGTNVYNVTLITQTFSAINIKMNSEDGSVVSKTITNLAAFGRQI